MNRHRLLWLLVLLDLVVLYVARHDPRGQVHIWIFPRASALLVLSPSAEAILLDGDMGAAELAEDVAARVPPLWGRLRLAVVTRAEDTILAAQVRLFQHLPPQEAWRVPGDDVSSLDVAWEEAARGRVHLLRAGRSLHVQGVDLSVVAADPPVILLSVGRMRIVYAPTARWEDTAPEVAQGAFMWVLGGLSWEKAARPLPRFVVLPDLAAPAFAKLAPTILRHPQTTFLVGKREVIHMTTDGVRYDLAATP